MKPLVFAGVALLLAGVAVTLLLVDAPESSVARFPFTDNPTTVDLETCTQSQFDDLASNVALEHLEIGSLDPSERFRFGPIIVMPKLRWLRIDHGGNDSLAAIVSAAGHLEILNLPDCSLTEAGLGALAQTPTLVQLRIGGVSPSADVMQQFADAGRLKQLHLLDGSLDAEAVAAIGRIETLQSFYTDRVDAPRDALVTLQTARPDLHLHIDTQHLDGHDHE